MNKTSFAQVFKGRRVKWLSQPIYAKLVGALRPKRTGTLAQREADLDGNLSHDFTEELQIEYLKRIAQGGSPGHIALDLGVTLNTVELFEKQHKEFKQAKEFARQLWFETLKKRSYTLGFVSGGQRARRSLGNNPPAL
jgi:hypothetical protein